MLLHLHILLIVTFLRTMSMSRWTVILLIIITNIITLVLYNISLKNSCQKAKLDVIQTAILYEEDLTLVEQHHHQEPNLAGDKKTSLFTERKQNIGKICARKS